MLNKSVKDAKDVLGESEAKAAVAPATLDSIINQLSPGVSDIFRNIFGSPVSSTMSDRVITPNQYING